MKSAGVCGPRRGGAETGGAGRGRAEPGAAAAAAGHLSDLHTSAAGVLAVTPCLQRHLVPLDGSDDD